jgi:hypothetical protein
VEELLAAGRVPSEPILDAVRKYVVEHGGENNQAVLEGIAARADVSFGTLDTWMRLPERSKSMRFHVADALLCAMNLWDLWYDELRDIYQNVDLNWKKCERDGCETWFNVGPRANHHIGKRRRKYCSTNCGQMEWLRQSGRIENSEKYNRKTHCRNGHKRSEYGKNAAGNCKGCVDDANARMRVKHAESRRAYQRKWYAANKEKKVEYQKQWRETRRIEGKAA